MCDTRRIDYEARLTERGCGDRTTSTAGDLGEKRASRGPRLLWGRGLMSQRERPRQSCETIPTGVGEGIVEKRPMQGCELLELLNSLEASSRSEIEAVGG